MYEANLEKIWLELEATDSRIADLEALGDPTYYASEGIAVRTGGRSPDQDAELADLLERRKFIFAAAARNATFLFPPQMKRGDNKAIEVYGDIADAELVVFEYPGMDNDLSSFYGNFDGHGGNVDALRLKKALELKTGRRVAVVCDMNYDVPGGLLAAAGNSRAVKAVDDTEAAIKRVHELNPSAPIALYAHSYGSVRVGEMLKRRDVSKFGVKVVLGVGTPGMNMDSVEDIKGGVPLFVATATDDPIRLTVGTTHGTDPLSSGFGANYFDASNAHGHSEFLEFLDGSTDLPSPQLINAVLAIEHELGWLSPAEDSAVVAESERLRRDIKDQEAEAQAGAGTGT
jgi:hypothetical protein